MRYVALAKWVALPLGIAVGLLALPLACTTVVRAPANASQIVSVFLIDEAKTSSLALPQRVGGFVRYAYGDWNWYALRNQSALDGLAALLWPTAGALGRVEMNTAATPDAVRRAIGGRSASLPYSCTKTGENQSVIRHNLNRVRMRTMR